MINARIATLAEVNGALSAYQGGFRSHRQVTDHVVRLCQDVSDGLHLDQPKRTAAVFLGI